MQRHLQVHLPEIWREIQEKYDLNTWARKPASAASPAAPPKPRKSTRTTPTEKAKARQEMLALSLDDLIAAVVDSPDALLEYCKAPDNYGVLLLRPIVEILRPDITAAVVLCELLFWRCRGKHGRPRVGKQNWLRKTHADIEAASGLTQDQIRGALQRLVKQGLCQRSAAAAPASSSRAWRRLPGESGRSRTQRREINSAHWWSLIRSGLWPSHSGLQPTHSGPQPAVKERAR